MSTASLLRRLSQLAATVADARWVRLYSTPTIELLAVGITVPILVVLAAWLGSALGLTLVWSQVAATTLGLALVTPSMLRAMLSSIPTETADTRSIAPTSLAEDASSFFVAQDYEGWSGLMANTLSDLTESQVELLIDLLVHYQEQGDLTQYQWGEAQAALDVLDEYLPESCDG